MEMESVWEGCKARQGVSVPGKGRLMGHAAGKARIGSNKQPLAKTDRVVGHLGLGLGLAA